MTEVLGVKNDGQKIRDGGWWLAPYSGGGGNGGENGEKSVAGQRR